MFYFITTFVIRKIVMKHNNLKHAYLNFVPSKFINLNMKTKFITRFYIKVWKFNALHVMIF